jgi:2-methylcitrate dehydratase PrpD
MGQYSIPFCVALSLYFDPSDPESFSEERLRDKKIIAMTDKVRLEVDREIEEKGWDRSARVTVRLKNKRRHSNLVVHFKGTPQNPLSDWEVEQKAKKVTASILAESNFARLVQTVRDLEKVDDVTTLATLASKRSAAA